jgi:hypothetical protein
MCKQLRLIALFIFLLSAGFTNAQEAFKHWAIGIDAGTYGIGASVATSISPNFKLRLGINHLGFNYKDGFDMDGIDGYLPELPDDAPDLEMTGKITDLKLNFTQFKVLVDYYPMQNGIFSLTAGLYLGKNTISGDGKIENYETLVEQNGGERPIFGFEDLTIQPEADGSFDAKIQLGNTIKPYVGIGLGRTIANSRVGFKFDLGVVFQGAPQFKSNTIYPGSNLDKAYNSLNEYISTDLLKLWPMLSFSLSYRIL